MKLSVIAFEQTLQSQPDFRWKTFCRQLKGINSVQQEVTRVSQTFEKWVLCNVIFCDNCAVMSRCQLIQFPRKRQTPIISFQFGPCCTELHHALDLFLLNAGSGSQSQSHCRTFAPFCPLCTHAWQFGPFL